MVIDGGRRRATAPPGDTPRSVGYTLVTGRGRCGVAAGRERRVSRGAVGRTARAGRAAAQRWNDRHVRQLPGAAVPVSGGRLRAANPGEPHRLPTEACDSTHA